MKINKVLLLFFRGTCSGIVRQRVPQEHLSFPQGKALVFLLENIGFLSQTVAFLGEALFMPLQLHCKPFFAFSRHVKCLLFASILVPRIAGSIYCDPRDGGSPCIVSLFGFSGPGRKAKFIIFLLPPPFAPKKSWNISCTFREGVNS